MLNSRSLSGSNVSAWVTCAVSGLLLGIAMANGASAQTGPIEIIALDCEATPLLPRGFRELGGGPDINDSGVVAFTDFNALYRYYLDTSALEELVNVEQPLSTGEVIRHFGDRVHINSQGCVAWQAGVQPVHPDPPCNPVILGCGETQDGACFRFLPIINSLLRAGDPGGCSDAAGTAELLLHEGQVNNPQHFEDFDILDDNRVALILETGVPGPNEIVLVDAGSVASYLQWGGGAPEGGSYGCNPQTEGDAFYRITTGAIDQVTGLALPLAFTTIINDGDCLRTLASEEHGTVADCFNPLEGVHQGSQVAWKPGVGCVECFGADDSTAVHVVRTDTDGDVCLGGTGVSVLAETDVMADVTRILLQSQINYATLNGGRLCSIGGIITGGPELSASQLTSPPLCHLVGGAAVFRGSYRPDGGDSCFNSTEGLFACTGVDEVYVMVQEGDLLPDGSGLHFAEFGNPMVNSRGEVVFWASHDGDCSQPECGGIFKIDLADLFADPCPADVNGDGTVGINDLLELLAAWGPCACCAADINGDGTAGINDLLEMFAAWGDCVSQFGPPGSGPAVVGDDLDTTGVSASASE